MKETEEEFKKDFNERIKKYGEMDEEGNMYFNSFSGRSKIGKQRKKEEYDKSKFILMNKFSPVPFADEILKKNKIVYDSKKTLWRYENNEGIWKPNAEQFLRTLIRNKLLGDEQQKKHYIEEIIYHIKDVTYNENFEIDNNPYLIGFKNGVFDLNEEKFKPFSPEFNITNKLPIEIDENYKECPKIDNFFKDSVGEDYKIILYELCSYCLFKKYPYPKVFFIYGSSNTGKSKFIELLEKFLGKENICSVEPQDIQKDQYSTSNMLYKMANISSDINYNALDNINQVKKITGEDSVKIREMYKEPYNERIFAKQIFSTNKLPQVKEKTRAWYKRVYPVEFSNFVAKDKEDPFIINKITQKEELKGLAWKCLKYLKELKKRNFTFSYDIDVNEMGKVYEELSNPIKLFISQNCIEKKDEYVFKYQFKDRLNTWLKANHFPPISRTEVEQYMKEDYTNSNRSVDTPDGTKYYRVWSGLRFKTSKDSYSDTTFNTFNTFYRVIKKVYSSIGRFGNGVKSVKSVKYKIIKDISRFALPEEINVQSEKGELIYNPQYQDLFNLLEKEGYIIQLGVFENGK